MPSAQVSQRVGASSLAPPDWTVDMPASSPAIRKTHGTKSTGAGRSVQESTQTVVILARSPVLRTVVVALYHSRWNSRSVVTLKLFVAATM